MPDSQILDLKTIHSLAPENLPNFREERYQGGYFSNSLSAFSPDEQALIGNHYEQLLELMHLIDPDGNSEEDRKRKLADFVEHNELYHLSDQFEMVIKEAEENDDPHKADLLRRLTSGAFPSICWYILIISRIGVEPEYFNSLFYLTRDHLKACRAFVRDLDPERRKRDEEEIHHSIDLITEKWESSIYRAYEGAVKVYFKNYYQGHVAERCVEFAELDRIFYLMTNHSVEHSEGGTLSVTMAETEDGESLRWAFVHEVSDSTLKAIENFEKQDISLFERDPNEDETHFAETTTDLTFVGEAVTHAYGLPDMISAVRQGYIGSRLQGSSLILWFHWPRIGTV